MTPTIEEISDFLFAPKEIAEIVVGALRSRNYDAGITTESSTWKDFDIGLYWANLSIGSRRRDRCYMQVTWERSKITFAAYGGRWAMGFPPPPQQPVLTVDLARPDSLNIIVDFIVGIATEDKYPYPWLE